MERFKNYSELKVKNSSNHRAFVLFVLFIALSTSLTQAQEKNNFKLYGNIRYAYTTSEGDFGFDNRFSALRVRIGSRYFINSTSSVQARIATTFSDDLETPHVTLIAENPGLNLGTLSFDEFYYRYKKEDIDIKVGRFVHSISVHSNAKRSLIRFQGPHIFVNWTDGIYVRKNINNEWFGEFIGEYQNRNNVTYPYQRNLDFANSEHNLTTYFGVENTERDNSNIIQKGFGLFVAPNAYNKSGDYSTYTALTSKIVLDFPMNEALKGGSLRFAGELGQNVNTIFSDGTIAIASVGVNRFANKHDFMIELSSTDTQWLLASAYASGANEIEIRYKFYISKSWNFDTRYRVRDFSARNLPMTHDAFFRLNYLF